MDQQNYIVDLLQKHLQGTLDIEEAEVLENWANADVGNRRLLENIIREELLISDLQDYWTLWNDAERSEREERIFNLVSLQTGTQTLTQTALGTQPQHPYRTRILPRLKWISYAAAAVLVMGLGTLFFDRQTETSTEITLTDIQPGGNRAMLTLADGRTIELSTDQDGIVIGNEITYADGTSLFARHSDEHQSAGTENPTKALILKTPRGGMYRVTLPDGSNVWLNANSTLSYPTRFSITERVVQLEGEAYFEVQQQINPTPFRVLTAEQTVEVLGTEFNINAYPEETGTQTTLVNGSVEVRSHHDQAHHRIAPGEQLTTTGNSSTIRNVDVAQFTAWKEGRFSFDGKSFEQIMREMARWYDIEVQYEGEIPTDRYMGDAYRTDHLHTVLHFLESSNVSYRLEQPRSNGSPRLVIHQNKEEVKP